MNECDLKGKRVLIRQDLNVPIKDGQITSDARLRASIPSIKAALQQGAAVLVMSHLGRPTEGQAQSEFSLQPVADYLANALNAKVNFVDDYLNDSDIASQVGEVTLLENVRFNVGEKSNDDTLAKQYASLCDVFVMDAFGTAHRAQASTHGVAKFAAQSCAGPLLDGELKALSKALDAPKRPLVAIVGGSKVSTKLTVLSSLANKVDQLIVATEATTKTVDSVEDDDMIFDIGPQTSEYLANILKNAGTIVWNGPVGVFEFDQFGKGTEAIAQAIAQSDAFSIAGGGDTLAAVDKYDIADKVSYISTGGGAFLEFLEGKTLPAVAILDQD